MKKVSKIIVIALVIVMLPVGVFAKSFPYKDVTKKRVGKDAYKAITYVYNHKGYSGVIAKKAKKFSPAKKITRREFLIMLGNFYGDEKVPVSFSDIRNGKKIATSKWACDKMVGVAKKGYGMDITWNGNKTKLTRALASQYLFVFASFDPAFKPRR